MVITKPEGLHSVPRIYTVKRELTPTPVLWLSQVCHGMCPQDIGSHTLIHYNAHIHTYVYVYNKREKVKIMFLIKAVFAWKHSECQQTAGMCLQLWSAAQLMDQLFYISRIRHRRRWKSGQSPSMSNCTEVWFSHTSQSRPCFLWWSLSLREGVCYEAALLVAEHTTDLVPAAQPLVSIRLDHHPPHRKKLLWGLRAD